MLGGLTFDRLRWPVSDVSGAFDEFEAIAPWVAHEEPLLAGESVAGDYFYACGFEALAQGCETGDAKGGMAARVAVDHRRVFLGGQMQLLDATLVPGAGVAAVGIGGPLSGTRPSSSW